MPRIPFIEARFFNPDETPNALETRFDQSLRALRRRKIGHGTTSPSEPQDLEGIHQGPSLQLSAKDHTKIQRRAKAIIERRKAASGLDHLKREDRERLDVLRSGAQLLTIPSEHRADELASDLHSDMPWMAAATEIVWQTMRRSVREGWDGLRLPPLLLDGPPGIGKSHWARRLGELLSVPTTVVEATGENASFGVVGIQRGWSGSCPGRLIETVLRTNIANPVIIVDEVEKAGRVISSKGNAFGLAESLLPLLEPMTAKRWSCPYFQVKFDMSWISWVLTSNNFRLLPDPLLSRCPPIHLRSLSIDELEGFLQREGRKRKLCSASVEAIMDVVSHPSLRPHRPSLRVAARMLQRAADLEHAPLLH